MYSFYLSYHMFGQ